MTYHIINNNKSSRGVVPSMFNGRFFFSPSLYLTLSTSHVEKTRLSTIDEMRCATDDYAHTLVFIFVVAVMSFNSIQENHTEEFVSLDLLPWPEQTVQSIWVIQIFSKPGKRLETMHRTRTGRPFFFMSTRVFEASIGFCWPTGRLVMSFSVARVRAVWRKWKHSWTAIRCFSVLSAFVLWTITEVNERNSSSSLSLELVS